MPELIQGRSDTEIAHLALRENRRVSQALPGDESAADVNPGRWQFSEVKGGVSIGGPSEYFDTKEDALVAFEGKFRKPNEV